MSIRNLNRLFLPRSVAVIGASPKKSTIGRTVLSNLVDEEFLGSVYPVNPKYEAIEGIRCLSCVDDILDPLDLAIVCTPAATVPGIVDECGRSGVLNVLILSAGFREAGAAGRLHEDELHRVASKYPSMRIVGPNCLGILSPHNGLNASFARRLPKPGRTAFLSQSGALCTAILDWAIDEGFGFSVVASLGNAIDVDFGDMIDYLATDPHTDSIVMYLESIDDARKFMSAARAFIRSAYGTGPQRRRTDRWRETRSNVWFGSDDWIGRNDGRARSRPCRRASSSQRSIGPTYARVPTGLAIAQRVSRPSPSQHRPVDGHTHSTLLLGC